MPKTKQFDEAVVLQKARDVFWKKGYNGSSMDELVTATGLSRSSIYDTFGDKHGLYVKALEHYRQAQLAHFSKEIPASLSPRERFAWLFKNTMTGSINDRQRKGCFMLNTTTELANIDSSINRLVCNNMDTMEDLFLTWVKEGQASGNISKRFTAKALARYLFSSFNGLVTVGQTKPDKSTLEDIIKVSLSVLN